MRGARVIARDYKGAALVRRVWAVGETVVYLSDEDNFKKLEANQEALPPVGFPKGDVFDFQSTVSEGKLLTNWKQLKTWTPLAIAK